MAGHSQDGEIELGENVGPTNQGQLLISITCCRAHGKRTIMWLRASDDIGSRYSINEIELLGAYAQVLTAGRLQESVRLGINF